MILGWSAIFNILSEIPSVAIIPKNNTSPNSCRTIVAQCRKRFAQKFASTKFHKKTAKICELYTKRFPILFPECSITRKQHVLSIVAPKQIRQQQIVYKILKLVERGENLHCKLNKLDRQYVNMLNKADRMFFMMKEYETSLYIN